MLTLKKFTNTFFIAITFAFTAALSAQDADDANDSIAATEKVTARDEIVFDEIAIEGVVDKPNVAILPKRVQPQLGKLEFVTRSFDSEIKALPPRGFLFDKKFDSIKLRVRVSDILSQITGKK